MTYDPVAFWDEMAPHIAGPGAASPEHERQEAALEKLLSRLDWTSVCEIGVGGGRITDLIRRVDPSASYTGIDIGAVQLDRGRQIRPDGTFELAAIEDFDPGRRRWDLVVASEVLMHVVPGRIADAIRNIQAMARRHIVIVEWVPPAGDFPRQVAPWNFPHDYGTLLNPITYSERTDRQMIFHCKAADA